MGSPPRRAAGRAIAPRRGQLSDTRAGSAARAGGRSAALRRMKRPRSPRQPEPFRTPAARNGPCQTPGSSLPRPVRFPECAPCALILGAAPRRNAGTAAPVRLQGAKHPTRAESTPAKLHALFDADRRDACDRMIGDELLASVLAHGLLAALDVFGDRLDPVRRHEQRILLGGCADDAILDPFHALTAAVDGDDRDALLPARRLEGRVTAVGRRLVDGVDQIDVRRLLENVLHRLPAAFGGAFRIVGAYDLRAVALGIVLGILDLDPEAGEEAVVTQIVDGRLVGRQVERGDLGVLGLVAERPLGPLADEFAGL